MIRPTRLILAPAALAATMTAAFAQPLQLPGAQPFNPPGTQQAAPAQPGAPAGPKPPAMPAIRVAGEDAILGKVLHRHGHRGEAVFSKTAAGYGLRLALDGFQSANLIESCAVSFGETPVPVTPLGRPDGVPRYRLEAPVCPIVLDVLDGAFLVVEPAEPCIVEAAQCRIDPRGLWGPDARTLAGQAKEIEKARGSAERAVREGYRTLTAKSDAVEQRTIAREQAGFSAEREMICRDFQREGQLGFCAARITEARAASLRARLGLDAEPKPAAKPRPRPAAAKPAALPPAPTQ
ncbi:hypothetical protein [Bosea sp. (in: a-proteobacteria)]|uniref:hypothetical protein n=1 Tax=Bosea sp. (in: a-proteobacteria) TaxID=1871050 RepID=UPI00260E0C23|nr:hypothetical protein [Bosea sp. (in: a-proteobacteria)]MCO5090450.1 hypothetical protein [Bosea sp. (in: a-proteobacteria)]